MSSGAKTAPSVAPLLSDLAATAISISLPELLVGGTFQSALERRADRPSYRAPLYVTRSGSQPASSCCLWLSGRADWRFPDWENCMKHASSEQRLAGLRLEYAERFREICRTMKSGDFDHLVDEMARFRLKYEDLEAEVAKQPREGGAQPPR
jgi:hypothetical protein